MRQILGQAVGLPRVNGRQQTVDHPIETVEAECQGAQNIFIR